MQRAGSLYKQGFWIAVIDREWGFGHGPENSLKNRPENAAAHIYDMSPDEELLLMQRIAVGDRDAFSEVLDKYMTYVYRFSFSLLKDRARAEDITQESCLRLWNNAAQWKPPGRVKSWLLRIVHNLCMDDLRSAKNHMQIEDCAESALVSTEPDPRQHTQERQVSDIIRAALLELPERQRAALMLIHYSDCTNPEAAAIMGISVDAVESLLARGKRTLRDLLGKDKDTLLEG